jgi:hypothetical protein
MEETKMRRRNFLSIIATATIAAAVGLASSGGAQAQTKEIV